MNAFKKVWGGFKSSSSEKHPENESTKIVLEQPSEPATILTEQTVDNEMQHLEKEIEVMKNIISDIDKLRSKLKKEYDRALTATTVDENHKAVIQREQKNMSVKIGAAKKALEQMKTKTQKLERDQGLSAIVRIREQQHADFLREIMHRKNKIEGMKQEYDANSKDRLGRTLRIINQDITDDMVQNIIEKDELSTADLFQKQFKGLTATQKHTLDTYLSDAQETHRDILEMQRSFMELHAMFQDFHNILEEQEPMFDIISHNIERATIDLQKGSQNMRDAKSYLVSSIIRKALPF
jgi:t-SNARE complex subunit (syntaxin)